MPGNKYVGRNTTANNGLVLQSKTEIDTNEFGLMQGTLKFYLLNDKWPDLEPARGTPLSNFTAGDSNTQSVFNAYGDYIGKQTARFIRNGCGPGVGTLEVLCQGAKFTDTTTSSIVAIDVTGKGAGYSAVPSVSLLLLAGTQVEAPFITVAMELSHEDVFAGGTGYVANDIVTISGGTWGHPVRIKVVTAGTGGSIKPSDGGVIRVIDRGSYNSLPANHCSVTGGTGSGATLDVTWRVGSIIVDYGGVYSGVSTGDITASLTGATGTINAVLGTVHMGNATGAQNQIEVTAPWKPTSTTKDTVQFFISNTTSSNGFQVKFATTADLGDALLTNLKGPTYLMQNSLNTSRLVVDGSPVSSGDIILVKNETLGYRNGIYTVAQPGSSNPSLRDPWILQRHNAFDEASAFTTALFVVVQSGSSNANTNWNCATNVTNLGVLDSSGGDTITFNSATLQTFTISDRVTLDYHAIDLHFEYVANRKLQQPQFIQNEYSMDGAGYINTASGEKQLLQIDSATSETVTVDNTTGNTQYTPSPTPVPRSTWSNYVKFVGTAARFDQTPAGQFWHIVETATIKIVPLASTPT